MKRKKKHCTRERSRSQRRKEVEGRLDQLSAVGLIGAPKVVDGQKMYEFGPEHLALMCEILSHPEKWPDTWTDEQRRQAYYCRDLAIAKGLIQA